jgi:hypothetical protein
VPEEQGWKLAHGFGGAMTSVKVSTTVLVAAAAVVVVVVKVVVTEKLVLNSVTVGGVEVEVTTSTVSVVMMTTSVEAA